ncbi:hypothetical protein LUZ63_016909 [Rhynchospora breviuscula]|uniref:Uncharacterized protein n=1 Tax=Rhynchospora breviuscula TaxID=2022672 RepID=A0A9Q0C1G6_9POAL|nr:hypothetical protein LUZ63_016909 [Rhynchospora breviuscula]
MPLVEPAFGLAALGWVASPVIKDLVSKGISYLGSDMAEELDDLETILLPQFQLTIQAAQNSPHKDKLEKWLDRLKNAYYGAEAILHDLEYERLKRRAKGDDRKKQWVCISSHPIIKPLAKVTSKVTKKTSPVMEPLKTITKKVNLKASPLSPQKKKLLAQLNKLKKIAAEAKEFRELLGIQFSNEKGAPIRNRTSEITSFLRDKVFGRDQVRDQIIKYLLDEQGESSSTRSYSVVAITGIGGAGKTTLAQYVYNDEIVQKYFGVTMWLCLSENKDMKEYTKEMIGCASGKKCEDIPSLDHLQKNLKETLSESKSILLVLDNVLYDEKKDNEWDNFFDPFVSIGGRFGIVVTSRETLFPNAFSRGKLLTIELPDLSPNDFQSLFRYYAMDGLEISDLLKTDLCDIGDHIAEEMNKSPLAAKVIGNQLRKQPEITFWQKILQSDILSSTREILLWSYQNLEEQLQRCILFDSLFPKGSYVNDGIEWVRYWVALDFIQCSDNNRNVEDVALEYFNKMVANGVVQLVDGKYYMHDLFRDLAQKLSIKDCFRVTSFEKETPIPSTTLYVYMEINKENVKKYLSSICDLRNVRALILDTRFSTLEDVNEVLPMVCNYCKHLRVLQVISNDYLKELPSVVGNLRNLRYLEIWESSIEVLPDTVSQLYHLQFLLLPTSIKALPPKMSDLIKLRNIIMYDRNYNHVHSLPPIPYLGKLTSLQSLSEFHVRSEVGYELCQLGCLNEIAGSLRIVNLENVRQKDEAIEARLFEKPKLKRLELVWAESSENGFDSEVIEALQPAKGLQSLSIEGYGGSRCPSWLLEGSFLRNIKYLKFYNCSGLRGLPPNFHQLCPYLTEFRVGKCPRLIFVCENELQLNNNEGTINELSLFPLDYVIYNELEMIDVLNYESGSIYKILLEENYCGPIQEFLEADVPPVQDDVPCSIYKVLTDWSICHQKRMDFIFRCKTKTNKLLLPSKLHVLFISFCCISDGTLSDCLRGMATIKELYFEGIMTITTLPPVEVLKDLHSLRDLTIKNCWCLRSLDGLHALPNLEKFILDTCWNLKMKSDHTELPPTLQSIIIEGCEVSQTLSLDNLQFLRHNRIRNSGSLTNLSFGHLTSLQSLHLIDCPKIQHIQSLVPLSFIDTLSLLRLPNLDVKISVLKTWKGCRRLYISSSAILNELQLLENFDAIQTLIIEKCDEDVISFEKSDHLRSIKTLRFYGCKLKHLSSTLSNFSNLEIIHFRKCSRISKLPELPKSVQEIIIEDCPELKERCQPNGTEWHKIQYIQSRSIE